MNVKEAVKLIGSKFVYKSDNTKWFDNWHFLKEDIDGNLVGDCEDFSLSCLFLICDKSWLKFIWYVFITHQYKIYHVRSLPNNGGHAVANVGDLWFDNWTKEALPKDEFFDRTKHKKWFMYPMPLMIPFFIYGLLKR